MEVKPVVAVVTQKLTDILNDKSVADNKVMMHQLKGVQKSLKKLRSFSEETDVSDASQTEKDVSDASQTEKDVTDASQTQRATDHLRVLYEVEDEIEKFTFRVAQQRKKYGFLMKQTFFFNNLNSCRRLKSKINKIQRNISGSPGYDASSPTSSSLNSKSNHYNSVKSISSDQKSSSHVWPVSQIPSTPSPEQRFLTRSFSLIPYEHVLQRKKLTFSYSYNEEETNFVGFKEEHVYCPKQTSSFSYQEDELGVFGLSDDIQSLVKRLTQSRERSVSRFTDKGKQHTRQNEMFVPIVGEVGSGKTTLARAVYRNRKIKDHFEFHDWISVTEECTTETIWRSVSKKGASVKDHKATSPEQEAQKILKGKRYMIVLDGIENHRVLEDLKEAFPDENNGSKVIFTSREFRRSPEMNMNPHIMNPLNENESWNMFLKKAGKEKEADQIHTRSKRKILNICNGLPLNIVLIARLLSTKNIDDWSKKTADDRCSNEVLAMCYNDLSIHSKLCLLYLALFPKDYDIPVRRLLRLWIAEGFVKRRSHKQFAEDLEGFVERSSHQQFAEDLEGFVERSSHKQFAEDLVQTHFEDLVDRSMIQITKLRSDNSPRQCRLVSVFHDYLLPKAQDISLFYIRRNFENFDDAAGPFGVRRMVQHTTNPGTLATSRSAHSKVKITNEEDNSRSSSTSSHCLFLCGQKDSYTEIVTSHSNPSDLQNSESHGSTFDPSLLRSYVSFNFQRKDMPEREVGILLGKTINSRFSLLRVLDLEGVYKPLLPDKLGHLCQLRYLGLRWTFLESIPESVGDLSYLETLDVKHTRVDSLPVSIWKLKQLRHLNLNDISLAMPPSSSSTLLTLWGLVLDEKISVNEGLGKLLGLRELGIKFHLNKSQGILLDWITKLKHLQSLRLRSVNDMGKPSKLDLKPLHDLEKLSHLNLYGNLEKLPTLNEFPPTLKVLTLSISKLNKDPMETLEQLPFLIVLRLLGNSYTGEKMVCRQGGFKKLQVLKLWVLEELEEWEVEEDAMENLKELEIRRCYKLNNIPSRLLQKQRSLEELILTDMPNEFVGWIKNRKSKDTSLTINY